jgi:transposase InsO family protein
MPNQNAFIERFNKSFRHEVLDANPFNTLLELQEVADQWLRDYNECRPHKYLGSLLPAVFKPRVCKSEISTLEFTLDRGVYDMNFGACIENMERG